MGMRVRRAGVGDHDALVGLRIANAERHVELDPGLYRLPDVEAVRRHFDASLSGGSESLVLVAETGTRVVGMAELVPLALPPDHQILIPRPAAEIHTVVLDGHRGEGVGAALVAAIERAAVERGIVVLYAGIFAPNTGATRFYSAAGFGPRGTLLSKELPTRPACAR